MKDENQTFDTSISPSFAAAARPIVTVDVAKYQAMLDGSGLTDAQKEEFLRAMWSVMMSFVELGFGIHPLQEVCGQKAESFFNLEDIGLDQVESEQSKATAIALDTGPPGGLEAE